MNINDLGKYLSAYMYKNKISFQLSNSQTLSRLTKLDGLIT